MSPDFPTTNRLKFYDEFLLQQRGYISKLPPAGEPVVLLFSGGLDSVLTAAMLMDSYGLVLFPLFIDRGQGNILAEKRAVSDYEKIFSQRHPSQFMPVKTIVSQIPPNEIKDHLKLHVSTQGYPLRNTQLQNLAVIYAYSLESSHNISCHTVFTATVPGDGFSHNTLESMRATTLSVCENLDNWNWIVTTPNSDPSIGESITKEHLVRWAEENDIPSEHTVSCGFARENTNHLNCGVCESCIRRKAVFADAGILDKTIYFSNTAVELPT